MTWANHAKKELRDGKTVKIRPSGNSMRGRIEHRSLVTLEPCDPDTLSVGDAVLVRVKGRDYLHLIKAIKENKKGKRFQIGNNCGGINGWVGPQAIYGLATNVEP